MANNTSKSDQIHFKESTIVDLHAHPSLKVSLFNRMLTSRFYSSRAFDPFSVRTDFPKLKEGGLDTMLSVVYAPEKGIVEECRVLRYLRFLMPRTWNKVYIPTYIDVTLKMIDEIEKMIADAIDPVSGKALAKVARSAPELESILGLGDDRPIGVVHCVEGGHSLDGNLDNLQRLSDRGVAYMTLAHFFENEIVHPCFPWPESVQKFGCFQSDRDVSLGLKPFGEQVVEKMMELGMLIDVSHCTPPARARIYDIVDKRAPLMATHVGAYEINPSPYNLQDWEIKRIAEGGGVVGVIFMNYWLMPHETKRGINFVARTIDHFAKTGGIDHVSIGSDFDGFTDPPDDLKDASELPKLTQRLVAEGYSQEAIIKIWGANALRVLREGWGKQN
ncbi:MAG: membrane dipeptidase [Anaerolineales bacterium]|jgi:microsomal dipeptidase-like Zn-dependent dipeptidase